MFASRRELDRPDKVEPIQQPAPKPPRETRPLKLSVTAIEDWLRDPYTIYAKYILRLDPLDPVDMPLSAADRGSAIHDSLGEFTQTFATRTARQHRADVARHRRKIFRAADGAARGARAVVAALSAHRRWFAEWEAARRGNIADIDAEIRGEIRIPLDNERTFILSARADRIERRRDGRYAILDYKTGQPPTGKQVRMGLSPQLTLEAAILREGGFEDIDAGCLRRRTRLCQAERQQPARRAAIAGAEDQEQRHAAVAGRRRPITRGRSSRS